MYHKCFGLVVSEMTTPNKGYYSLGFCTLRRTNIQIKLAPPRAHPLSFRNPKGVEGRGGGGSEAQEIPEGTVVG